MLEEGFRVTGPHAQLLAQSIRKTYFENAKKFNDLGRKLMDSAHSPASDGNLEQAVEDCEQAAANFTTAIGFLRDPTLYTNRGAAYYLSGKMDKSLADLNKAIRLDSKFIPAYDGRGSLFFVLGEFDKSIADFTQVLKSYPKNINTLHRRGTALLYLGKFNRAIGDFNRAIKINSNHQELHNNLGYALGRVGRSEDALVALTKAIDLNPEGSREHRNLSWVLTSLARYDDAIKAATTSIELESNSTAYANRGHAYRLNGDRESAIKDYKQALLLFENKPKNNIDYYIPAIRVERELVKLSGAIDESGTIEKKAISEGIVTAKLLTKFYQFTK